MPVGKDARLYTVLTTITAAAQVLSLSCIWLLCSKICYGGGRTGKRYTWKKVRRAAAAVIMASTAYTPCHHLLYIKANIVEREMVTPQSAICRFIQCIGAHSDVHESASDWTAKRIWLRSVVYQYRLHQVFSHPSSSDRYACHLAFSLILALTVWQFTTDNNS